MTKRERQRTVKIFKQGKPKLKWIGNIFSIASILLSLWSKQIFESNPHEWYDITGRLDILLLGLALLFSLINMYIKANLWFVDAYIGNTNSLKAIWAFGGIVIPFLFLIRSLVIQHELYIVPIVSLIIVHFYNHYKSKSSAKKRALISINNKVKNLAQETP